MSQQPKHPGKIPDRMEFADRLRLTADQMGAVLV